MKIVNTVNFNQHQGHDGCNKLTGKEEQCVSVFLIFRKFNVLYFYIIVAMEKLSSVAGLLPYKKTSSLTAHENCLRLSVNLCSV